ncbi:hypothetical protein [Absiella sp. AM29-15]|uniref:hypothetical protein n=1 Tax=Absiella sp. AM29-15 TaxID=2292278 RepID=UPI000E401CCE|nr:hypothetical protein [Absiella sp. AM29-15]RGC45102.1 hypothetical protein DW761_19095 [Absiella sp. AM29-15]
MNKIVNKFKNMDSNNKIVMKNTIMAFFVKGGALAISLLSTPAFIKYFNNYTLLGVWYTMLSILIWFLNFDLGIGNGIRNNLTIAIAKHDKEEARFVISSGFFSSFIVTLILTFLGILLLKNLNLNSIFNISKEIINPESLFISALFIFLAIMLRFLLTSVSAIFYALQKSAINNLLALCVSVLQLLFILFFRFNTYEKSLIFLSIAYFIFSNLPILIGGLVIFKTILKDCKPSFAYINTSYIKKVLSIGNANKLRVLTTMKSDI